MVKIRVGCKNYLMSSKKGGAYLFLADIKTTTKEYAASDISVPDEGEAGEEEVNMICPFCNNNLTVCFKRESTNELRSLLFQRVKNLIIGFFAFLFIISVIPYLIWGNRDLTGLITILKIILIITIFWSGLIIFISIFEYLSLPNHQTSILKSSLRIKDDSVADHHLLEFEDYEYVYLGSLK